MSAKRTMSFILVVSALLYLLMPLSKAQENLVSPEYAADALFKLELFSGKGVDGAGHPIYALDDVLTRQEAVTMLVRLIGKAKEAERQERITPFTDVDAWAQPYVGYAYQTGLTLGIDETSFGANSIISANQYVTFILRALGYNSETDFTWSEASTLFKQIQPAGEVFDFELEFTRGKAAIISFYALQTFTKDTNSTLLSELYDSNAVSKEAINNVKLTAYVPDAAWSLMFYSDYPAVPDYGANLATTLIEDADALKIYSSSSGDMEEYKTHLFQIGYEDITDNTSMFSYNDAKGRTQYAHPQTLQHVNSGQVINVLTIYNDVYIKIGEKFIMPDVARRMAQLQLNQLREENGADYLYSPFENDDSFFKYGNIQSTLYIRKASIKTVNEFWQHYLQRKYVTLYTPIGELELDVQAWDKSNSLLGQRIDITVEFGDGNSEYGVITETNIPALRGPTNQQKYDTVLQLEQMMQDIYQDAVDLFPDAKITGRLHPSGYHYPNLKVDYYSSTSMSWSGDGGFHWTPDSNDYELNKEMFE